MYHVYRNISFWYWVWKKEKKVEQADNLNPLLDARGAKTSSLSDPFGIAMRVLLSSWHECYFETALHACERNRNHPELYFWYYSILTRRNYIYTYYRIFCNLFLCNNHKWISSKVITILIIDCFTFKRSYYTYKNTSFYIK